MERLAERAIYAGQRLRVAVQVLSCPASWGELGADRATPVVDDKYRPDDIDQEL